jgi:hypothetical protein
MIPTISYPGTAVRRASRHRLLWLVTGLLITVASAISVTAGARSSRLAVWIDVAPYSYGLPQITIDPSIYPDARGVQFLVNGLVDDQSPARPNGYDATGPADNSTFHVFPKRRVRSGDILEARWTDRSGSAWTHRHVAGDDTYTPPTPTPPNTVTWTKVIPDKYAMPEVTIGQAIYPDSRGVQFFVNGSVDERSTARPDGYDATGPSDGSAFHIYPSLRLREGDLVEARWTDREGVVWRHQHVVGQGFDSLMMISAAVTAAAPTTAPATTAPATTAPATTAPATTAPATTAPATTAPATTAPATTAPATTAPATTAPATTAPATTAPPTELSGLVWWSSVDPGSSGWPAITIDETVYPDTRGVQFLVNGVVDERSPTVRPNGYDATGPADGSVFHIYPTLTLSTGDVLEARWTDRSGVAWTHQHLVGNVASEPPATTVPATTVPAPSSSSGEFPTFESTGPRVAYSQMTVHQGDLQTAYDGQVIEKMDIRGNLRILHDNVIVRDTRVMMTHTYGLDARPMNGVCPTGTLYEYVEVDGRNAADVHVPVYGENCAWTLDHARVHNVGAAIHVVRNNTVSNSYIYSSRGETVDIHRNAIQHHGGYGNNIVNNTLYCEGNGCSSALALYGEVAAVQDILIEHNLLAATAGYCTYTGSLSYKPYPNGSNVRYIDNHFSTRYFPACGRAGVVEGSTAAVRGNVWQGNIWHETGQPIN